MINEEDGWRGRDVWYPGEFCMACFEKSKQYRKALSNIQEPAEIIVAEM